MNDPLFNLELIDYDLLEDDVVLDFPAPLPPAVNSVLIQWQFMLLSDMMVHFSLNPTSANGRRDYTSSAGVVPLNLPISFPDNLVATANDPGDISPVEPSTFGTLKALYR